MKLSTSIVNIGLRGLGLGGKILIFTFIAKLFSSGTLGVFSLFIISIAIAKFIIGFEFHTYNTRELLAQPAHQRMALVRDHFVFTIILFVLFAPIVLLLFTYDIISSSFIPFFYVILLLDYIANEFVRLFATLSKPVLSNLLLFMISGAWAYPVIGRWIFYSASFNFIWYVWILFDGIAVLLSIIIIATMKLGPVINIPINWKWIKKGAIMSVPFLVSAISFKIIDFSDRYFIDYWHSKAFVGIYSFFSGIAYVVFTVSFTLVILIYYPLLVQTYQSAEYKKFSEVKKRFIIHLIIISLITILIVLIMMNPVLSFIGKKDLVSSIDIFYVLVGSIFIFILSQIPHYGLYVQGKDNVIMVSTIAAAIINILLNYLLVPKYKLVGAAIATTISIAIMTVIKWYFAFIKYKIVVREE